MTVISEARPVLVVGRTGQLGEALQRKAQARGIALVAGEQPEVDLTKVDRLQTFIMATRPSVVINAAAYTAVDRAESEPDLAFAINGEGPARLASLCSVTGVPFIHVSTDFVFSGLSRTPYGVDQKPAPLGVYGASKAAGEIGVKNAHPQHVLVRTSWVYGAAGQNFVKTMLRLGAQKGQVGVVNDQVGAPTFADDLADALLSVAQRVSHDEAPQLYGTFHFSNAGETTWHGFAAAIFERARKAGAV
ncbi:MAG: dTDP-4-dehydrorhamnose reductase, partial [Pseudomonadota bacterium]